jgi:hypothetical protein
MTHIAQRQGRLASGTRLQSSTTYVRRRLTIWQERLHLQSWRIRLYLGTRLPLTEQGCAFHGTEQRAHISLNVNQPRLVIDHILAHELAHLIESPTNRFVESLLWTYRVPPAEQRALLEQLNDAQNLVIEHWLRVVYAALGEDYPPYQEPSPNGHRPEPGLIKS